MTLILSTTLNLAKALVKLMIGTDEVSLRLMALRGEAEYLTMGTR